MTRLCAGTLHGLPAAVGRPGYDRAAVRTGIVHLGIGAFHRAHQAVCTEAVLQAGDLRWGILGASLRGTATRDALGPQDGLYAVNIRGAEESFAVIGAVQRLLVAPEDPEALIAAMAHPDVAIVSLTVTEKGYGIDTATGALDTARPEIAHDLVSPGAPKSMPGLLTAAIQRRRAAGLPPFTLLSCDNLAANGAALRRVLTDFAGRVAPGLDHYIEDAVPCPDTMVDRIVPATTAEDRDRVAAALGVRDAWPVVGEPFLQWVIEDRFAAGRPDWETHGATLVRDVAPYEAMKLRLLNASHSALAYLGLLAGDATVFEAVRDPGFAAFAAALMRDAAATLSMPPGMDVAGYGRSLLDRFANPALRHRLAQIAMDGSQKLPPRLVAVARECVAQGLPIARHAVSVAAWMRYVAEADPLDDPLGAVLARVARAGGPTALLEIEAVFGTDLPRLPAFREPVLAALARIEQAGARQAAAEAAGNGGG